MTNKQKNISSEDVAKAAEYYAQGREMWRQGRRGEAITLYNKAVALNPESPAVTALQMINQIMDFYDTNQFNP